MSSEEETKYCSNCKRQIAVVNFVMHEVHCRRNIVLCEHCDEPVPRSELGEHHDEYHVKVKCDRCGHAVEKMTLQDHTENLCLKRPKHCDFCELDFPQCEIDDHLDYCGSRTEPCPLCGQFIMQKDFTRHEDSNCTYPETKPAVNNNGRARNQEDDSRMSQDASHMHNNFALGEINRLMGQSGAAASSRSTVATRGRGPRSINQTRAGVKKTNEISSTRARRAPLPTRNTRSDTSTDARIAACNTRSDTSTDARIAARLNQDMNTDELLATHLAQDLSSESPYDLPVPDMAGPGGYFDADGLTLPCEFCDELFPVEGLIQHQTICRPEVNYYEASDPDGTSVLNNARVAEPPPQSSEPNIVDNLSYLSMQDMQNGPVIDSEDTMLPCEFCDQLFPGDSLIQHQAVCDANQTQTPRMGSPSVPRYGARRLTNPKGPSNPHAATRRQQDPIGLKSTNRPSHIKNTVPSRNHFPNRPAGHSSGVDKWLNSDHVRPGTRGAKNTNVARAGARSKSTNLSSSRYGVNMAPARDISERSEGELTPLGGNVAASNLKKKKKVPTATLR